MVALALEVRFLDDRYHGVPEWPPSPGRLFQALVAGAAQGRGRAPVLDATLRWLEVQEPPLILAPVAGEGREFTTYVPNNDTDDERDPLLPTRIGKTVRARLLTTETPVTYLWTALDDVPAAVHDLAAELYQLGRGTDPAFARALVLPDDVAEALIFAPRRAVHRPAGAGAGGVDCPMPGTLDSLDVRHHAFRARLNTEGRGRRARIAFANPPRARFARVVYDVEPKILLFELQGGDGRFHAIDPAASGRLVHDWLSHAAARLKPDLAACAERFLIGRGAGAQDINRRVQAFALPTLHAHGDRAIRRLAAILPADCPLRADDVGWALSGSDAFAARWGRPVPALERTMLKAYSRTARRWRSETALALPVPCRRLGPGDAKAGTERAAEEVAARAAVATALRHAGIAAPVAAIAVQREPFAGQGRRAEAFAEGTRFTKHQMWHVGIDFHEPVRGPLLLGNGRFCGLGLMRPESEDDLAQAFAFEIVSGFARAAPEQLARALRRATLARAGDDAPPYVTGHDAEGGPLRAGRSVHVAYVADLPRSRLLVLPPHLVDHRDEADGERHGLRMLRRALDGLYYLVAGDAGRLELRPVRVAPDDPLFAPACVWESITPYRATRHLKRGTPEAALVEDVLLELHRRNLPKASVTVSDVAGTRAGAVSGQVRLTFAAAVAGPILLGQTRQKGGGLFCGTPRTSGSTCHGGWHDR